MKSCRLSKASFKISDEYKESLIQKYRHLFQKPHVVYSSKLFFNLFPSNQGSNNPNQNALFVGRIFETDYLEESKKGYFRLRETPDSKIQRFVYQPKYVNFYKILNSHFLKNYRFQKFDIFDFMKENRFSFDSKRDVRVIGPEGVENFFSIKDSKDYQFDLNQQQDSIHKMNTKKKQYFFQFHYIYII